MNQSLIDNSLLALAALAAILLIRFAPARKAGPVISFFLLFPPLVVFLNMWAHNVAVVVANIQRYMAGTFQYNFTVYAHLLFGVVFIVLSGYSIHCTRRYMDGVLGQKRRILWLNGAIALGFLPLIPVNPISALPVIAAAVSTITLLRGRVVHHRNQATQPLAAPLEEEQLLF